MKAAVLQQTKSALAIVDRPALEAQPGHAVVRLKAAALNRRDYWITRGMYPGIQTPVVLGSDGAGIVARVGAGVSRDWTDREVIINPGWQWGDQPTAQGNQFRILGMPDDGTLAEEVAVPVDYLHAKPEHVDWHEAAALPLAGLTAYRAVYRQGQVKRGEQVLVTGIGGGVATFALQFARVAGAEVCVTSSKPRKLARAQEFGARHGYDYTDEDWATSFLKEQGSPQLIIDSTGGSQYARLIEIAAPGGRIVNYGSTAGPPEKLDLFKVFWKQLHLIGSTMGSPDDFHGMLQLVSDKRIRPAVDEIFPLERVNDAIARMGDAEQFGKIVLQIA